MHFYMRLIPPRATFVMDMTEDERRLMEAHAEYLKGFFDQGKILAYGPVLDRAAPFGIALFDVAAEADARAIMDADPTIVAKLNRYELAPMRVVGARAPAT